LTTISVISVFECIIFKHIKSPLSLPAIQPMIQYVLHARDNNNKQKIDEFVEAAAQSIRDILLLEGKSIYFFLYSLYSIIKSSYRQQVNFAYSFLGKS
jgi:hypothetical protein